MIEPPTLLPAYSFTLSECTMMWSHVESEIHLAIEQDGERVQVAITVLSHCDPWGGHPEWEWVAKTRAAGSVTQSGVQARIVLEDPALPELCFDPALAAFDAWYESSNPPSMPLPDFWRPLLAWAAEHH